MKRNVINVLALLFAVGVLVACGTVGVSKMEKQVNEKVETLQGIINFSDAQATKIKKVELNFLRESDKLNKCKDCDKVNLLNELQEKRAILLQNILDRQQYLKYNAAENESMKNVDLIAE